MEKKKITLKDLAKILDVSISTASKALNDSHEISRVTKRRIRKVAKLHNYTPNKLASSLKSGKTKTIGVIIPSIKNRFFARVLYGIDKVATKEGYNIITCISNESFKKEVTNVQVLANGSIDGFIIAIAEETQINQNFNHFNEAISQGKPIVMFDRVTDMVDCDKVTLDDLKASYQATKYLIRLNCKNIVVISTIDHLSVGKLRIDGYKNAIIESFKKVNTNLIVKADASTLDDKIIKLLQDQKVDGILAIDEDSTLASLKIAKMKGYKIPKELSIIGYANEKIATNVTPTLTTINQHGVTIGESAAKILIDRLNKNTHIFKHKIIKSTMIKRASV